MINIDLNIWKEGKRRIPTIFLLVLSSLIYINVSAKESHFLKGEGKFVSFSMEHGFDFASPVQRQNQYYLDATYPKSAGSGNALHFNSSDKVSIANLSLGNTYTISFWVKFDAEIKANGNRQDIMYGISSARPHLSVNSESDGKIGLYTSQGNNHRDVKTAKTSWDANKWYHLTFSIKNNSQKIYVNGILDTSYSFSGGYSNWEGVSLGRSTGGFAGTMDELSIWSDDLDQSTIQGIMNTKILESHTKINKLLAYYRFDKGSNDTLYDLTTNYDGVLTYNSNVKWVTSGAPMGDKSTTSLGSSAVATIQTDSGGIFSALATSGFSSDEGVQVYFNSNAPNSVLKPAGVESILPAYGYMGVNKIGDSSDTYTVVIDYSSISGLSSTQKTKLVLLKRENDEDSTWELASNASHNNVNTGVITLPGQTGTQYVLGTANSFTDATAYFTNSSAGTILNVKNNGTGFGTMASGLSGASSVAYDATNDYAFVYRSNTIVRMKGDGTGQTTIVTGQSSTRKVIVDPDNQMIYFSDYTGGTIKKCSYTGSGLSTVKSGIGPLGIYLDKTNQVIYWADLGGSYIGKVNVDGTGSSTLVTGQADIRDVAYDHINDALFWTRGNQNTLYKKVGAANTMSLIIGATGIYGMDLDVDNQLIYWAENTTGKIQVARTDGTDKTTLYTSSGPIYVSYGRYITPLVYAGMGNALTFDGTNDYVSIPHNASLNLSGKYTIMAWAKTHQYGVQAQVIGKSNTSGTQATYSLFLSGSQGWAFQSYDGTFDLIYSNTAPTINEWYHLAGVYDAGNIYLYINGELVGSNTSGTPVHNSIPLVIGGFSDGQRFNGEIDEVQIWTDALSATEIANYYKRRPNLSNTDLLAYYSFDETSGLVLPDLSSNAHHGVLTNMTGNEWTEGPDSLSFEIYESALVGDTVGYVTGWTSYGTLSFTKIGGATSDFDINSTSGVVTVA
ncbi:MAG: hypothetical protein KDC83_15150, partial [Flavobacteriales bacterium]|nr:hypothetical protein [Flavobacteriales bacterium]